MKKTNSSKRRRQPPKRTPVWIILGGVLVLLAAVGMAFGAWWRPAQVAPEVTGAPALRASPEVTDLGNVQLGRQVQVDIRLANVGDQPLRFAEEPWIEVVEGW